MLLIQILWNIMYIINQKYMNDNNNNNIKNIHYQINVNLINE